LAAQKMAQEKPGQTLQSTALVHEAYLRLVDVEKAQHWNSRGHFFRAAAEAMRRILVENARRKARLKRGGLLRRINLDQADLATRALPEELLAVDEALDILAAEDPTAAEVARMRVFAGLPLAQIGKLLGHSRATAYRNWTYARARLRWLLSEAGKPNPDNSPETENPSIS
jgi:RNA polymerase sigma factor (TIGR02999 family)